MTRFLFLILILLLPTSAIASKDCTEAVSMKIDRGWKEAERARMMIECEEFQKYRARVKEGDYTASYTISPGTYVCRKREHYVEAYNEVLKRGNAVPTRWMNSFKSCRVFKLATLVYVSKQDGKPSPVRKIMYSDPYNAFYITNGYIHSEFIQSYADAMSRRIQ